MKVHAFAIGFVVVLLLCFEAFARTYIDDMDETDVNHIKQYSGFIPFRYQPGIESLPDRTVFQFENPVNPAAWARYRVNDATQVTAAIYSPRGTFVLANPQNPGEYVMGIHGDNPSPPVTPAMKQALFARGANAIYTNEGGSLKQLVYDRFMHLFVPPLTTPAGELIGYGVNIYHSQDGETFTRVQPTHRKIEYINDEKLGLSLCYEEYTASVPASALYVKVELTEITSIPAFWFGTVETMPISPASFISLASVEIYGQNLLLGEQEPLVQEPQPDPSYDYDWLDSLFARVFERESQETPPANEPAAKEEPPVPPTEELQSPEPPTSSGAAPKFEGTIRQPSSSSRASSASSAESRPEPEKAAETAEPVTPQPVGAEVFAIPRETGREDRFSRGVTGYIVVVSGAIVFTCVMPKKK